MGSDCTICVHFSKNFPGETLGPHLQEGDIPSRIYTAKGKNSTASRTSKIGALKTKNTQKCGEGGSTGNRQKMDSECTICIHFSKKFSGEAPDPTCRRGISTTASIQLRICKIRISERSFEDKKIHKNLGRGGGINTQSAKNGLRKHHLHPFFQKIPGGRIHFSKKFSEEATGTHL